MHHDSEKSLAIHSSVTALGLLKEKERWTKCVGGDIQNIGLQYDSDEVKGWLARENSKMRFLH